MDQTETHDSATTDTETLPLEADADAAVPYGTTIVEVVFEEGAPVNLSNGNVAVTEVASSDTDLGGILQRYRFKGAYPSVIQLPGEAEEVATAEAASGTSRWHDRIRRFEFATPEEAAAAAEELAGLKGLVKDARQISQVGPPAARPMPSDPLIGTPEDGVAEVSGVEQQSQWYLHRTRVPAAWEQGAFGQNVVIADVDWGCLTSHEELKPQLEYVRWMHDGSARVDDGPEANHGTAVLGIAGAAANGVGICGYAPDARLWMIRADPPAGEVRGPNSWASAIEHVRTRDAEGRRKVLLLEAETRPKQRNIEQFPAVAEAIRQAIKDGVVVCVAAGNGNHPANLGDDGKQIAETGSILVGATMFDEEAPDSNRREPDSNYGERVVVCAPGDPGHDVTCGHQADDDYRDGFGGTSSAAAKVAGAAALMLSVNSALSHHQVRDILVRTGRPTGAEPGKPIGVLLDTAAAVEEAAKMVAAAPIAPKQLPPPPQPAAPSDGPIELDEAA